MIIQTQRKHRRWLHWPLAVLGALASLFTFQPPARAADTLQLAQGMEHFNPSAYVYVLPDPDHTLTISQLLEMQRRQPFYRNNAEKLNLGISTSAFWLRLMVHNPTGQELDYYLVQGDLSHQMLYFYQTHQGEVISQYKAGLAVPRHEKSVRGRNMAFLFRIPPTETHTLYLRVESNMMMTLPLTLEPMASYNGSVMAERLRAGFMYGILITLFVYHLFMWWYTRDTSVVYYMAYLVIITGFLGTLDGFLLEFLPWSVQFFGGRHMIFFGLLMPSGLLLFMRAVMNTREMLPRLDVAIRLAILAQVLVFILSLLSIRLARQAMDYTNLLFMLTILGVPVVTVWKRQPYALYFLVPTGVLIASFAVYLLINEGIINGQWQGITIIYLGAQLQAVGYAFLLGRHRGHKMQQIQAALKQANSAAEASQAKLVGFEKQLASQQQQLENQGRHLETHKLALAKKNEETEVALNYATRIQQTMLSNSHAAKNALGPHFIFFRPRDEVGGDFYWFHQEGSLHFVAVADCTGHGVSGALLSMVGTEALNDVVKEQGLHEPALVLEALHKVMSRNLSQQADQGPQTDGMDLGFIRWDASTRQLTYAGAKIDLLLVDDMGMRRIKGSKHSLGHRHADKKPFLDQELTLHGPVRAYLYTDGYPNQFGGYVRRKFMAKRFMRLLLETSHETLPRQYEILEETLGVWMEEGQEAQIDDILVLGMGLNQPRK